MTAVALAISRALIHFVWQGSIVGFSLWIVLFGLRKKSANSRYLASTVALAVLASLPIVTTFLLYTGSKTPAAGPAFLTASQTMTVNAGPGHVEANVWLLQAQSWTLPIWSLGVLLFSMRLVVGYQQAFRLRRRGKPAGDAVLAVVQRLQRVMGVTRRIRVLISGMSDSPSVVGWLRPVILLPPATVMGLTPLQLEAILAHEIGHIKRYDYLVNMLQMMVETLLFYHPAVWWTSKKIRIERELCCDDLAVRFSGNALRYARALTTLEKLRLRAPGVAMASTGGPLLYRIQRLAGISAKEYGPSRVPTMLVIALGIVCFALNVPGMQGQDALGVRVDLGASSVIHRSPVPYPEAAQKQGITGTVQIEVKLDSIGNVADARVLTGPEELRKAALESVLNWHFTSDAARGTRLISILFSDQGKQVKVQEPLSVEDQERRKVAIAMAEADTKKLMLAAAELAAKEKEMQVVLTRRQQLEREMGAVQSKLQESNSTPEQLDALKAKLNALRAEFEATPRPGGGGRGNPFVGRMLKSISTPGFNDSVRADLISRLPIREGDTLSPQLLEQTSQAVRSYDEHLRVQFVPTDDGKAELRIVANERR